MIIQFCNLQPTTKDFYVVAKVCYKQPTAHKFLKKGFIIAFMYYIGTKQIGVAGEHVGTND